MEVVTQSHIARELGLSQSSVKAVFNPDPRIRLRPETRRRILTTAHKMGYVPHHAARRLARSRRHNKSTSFDQVGLIHLTQSDARDSFVDPVCLAIMQGAEYELSQLHASLTFVRVSGSGDWDKVERLTRAGGVDGWLIYGPANDGVVDRLKRNKLPYVILGDRSCTQPVYSVNVDNEAVGRLGAQHLASLGHRRVAYMAGGMRFLFQRQILDGYRNARKENGLDEDERLFSDLSAWKVTGVKTPIEWLQSLDPMPTAVFMPELGVALSLQPVLKQLPGELKAISVLTCGCAPPDGIGPQLTRIDLPMSEVGCQGALLLHRLASGARVESAEMKISPSLIEGGSTRPPSSSKSETTQ
jgi:DNA-binding LacI/PurR family transcriptional regulator